MRPIQEFTLPGTVQRQLTSNTHRSDSAMARQLSYDRSMQLTPSVGSDQLRASANSQDQRPSLSQMREAERGIRIEQKLDELFQQQKLTLEQVGQLSGSIDQLQAAMHSCRQDLTKLEQAQARVSSSPAKSVHQVEPPSSLHRHQSRSASWFDWSNDDDLFGGAASCTGGNLGDIFRPKETHKAKPSSKKGKKREVVSLHNHDSSNRAICRTNQSQDENTQPRKKVHDTV